MITDISQKNRILLVENGFPIINVPIPGDPTGIFQQTLPAPSSYLLGENSRLFESFDYEKKPTIDEDIERILTSTDFLKNSISHHS